MATYKGIRGVTIPTVDGDPGTIQLGEIWYNSSTKALRVGKTTAGAWASAPAINTGRAAMMSAGTSTAAVIAGGERPGTFSSAICEEFNGSSWTEVNNLTDARYNVASGTMGTQTAALAVGGHDYPVSYHPVESYDGTNWTESADMVKNRAMLACCGIQTAALAMASETPPTTSGGLSEEWDGSSWTEGNDLNNTRYQNPGAGTQTAALVICDYNDVNVESYNGTSWTEVNNVNTGRYSSTAFGIQTSAATFGGSNPSSPRTAATEQFDGTSWTEVGDMTLARFQSGSAGTVTSGLCISGGGQPSTPTSGLRTETEEWTGDYVAAASVTSS